MAEETVVDVEDLWIVPELEKHLVFLPGCQV